MIEEARNAAKWCMANDKACKGMDPSRLERALCVFAQNSFEIDKSRGAGVHEIGSKYAHRCAKPNCDFHGNNRYDGRLTCRSIRPIEAGETLCISYLNGGLHASTRCRRALLNDHRGFVCSCEDCEGLDAMRVLPCPGCQPRSEAHGLLINSSNSGNHGFLERIAAAGDVEWRCDGCGLERTDAQIDTLCTAPSPSEDWLYSNGRAFPLPLPTGGLLEWERCIEDATMRLHARMDLERVEQREASSSGEQCEKWEASTAVGELQALNTLLAAVHAVLGERHWVGYAVRELRVDAMLSLALNLRRQEGGGGCCDDERSHERVLRSALREDEVEEEEKVEAQDSKVQPAMQLFLTIWHALEGLWTAEHDKSRSDAREVLWWSRRFARFLRELVGWDCVEAFLSKEHKIDAHRVEALLAGAIARARLECGPEHGKGSAVAVLEELHGKGVVREALDAAMAKKEAVEAADLIFAVS